ncbi:vacJ lipoprotein [Alcanivorax hongdengensis A-11-3]|uniref:VacJ lipoprotein n=1 Tax=Alcanivorax hongdengensis A-11-3 TaxID=1177179 RepID=L0W8F8_9GAMM|nr:VacJ family lipoprotein [Alcanivorax hongdengensis]EKF72998.1 vacJ lipoprotein [Alcanivorax hongdengensis A-11-3]
MRFLLCVFLLLPALSLAATEEDDWGAADTAFDSPATQSSRNDDPWEGFNRKVFAFNETFDKYAAKPAAKAYRAGTPQWLDDTITRVFENMRDLRSGINSVLQWRWKNAGKDFGRFTLNSTLGVAGLFDVASKVNLEKRNTDLGLTLARWGVGEGPYLVLPFFGPSTVRDGATIWPETYLRPYQYIDHDLTRFTFTVVYAVDLRADLLDLEKSIVGDRYTFLRNAYLQRRRFESGDAPSLRFPDIQERDDEAGDDGW